MQAMIMEALAYLGRIILSLALGMIIGYEREGQNKPAGVRDVTLVTLGATLFSIISLELAQIVSTLGMEAKYDIGRIIAYTIVSIGFLGSGVILQNKNKLEGITTAGTLWCAVAIGVFCGLGLYVLAILSGIAIYFVLKLKHISVSFEDNKKRRKQCKRKAIGKKSK